MIMNVHVESDFSFKNTLALTSSVIKIVFLTLSVLMLIVMTLCTEVHKLQLQGWHTERFCNVDAFCSLVMFINELPTS